jgi:hypothetical protein
MEFRGEHLQEDAVPNISVGRLWMKEVRRLGLDKREIQQYPHHYPDERGVEYATIYPHAWLAAFRDWLQGHYLKEEFLAYIHKRALPWQPSTQKQLPPGSSQE